MERLDEWITGGRYEKQLLLVECPGCDVSVPVTAESEYGSTYWTPEECPDCGHVFTGEEPHGLDEGPDPYDRYDPDDDYEEGV
jgi:hypothetical protein